MKTLAALAVLSLSTATALPAPTGPSASTGIRDDAPDYERTFDRTLASKDAHAVSIEHSMGALEVRVWDKREVRVLARIEVRGDQAEEFGGGIEIELGGRDSIEIETDYPEGRWNGLSYGVRMQVWMPAGLALRARNSFGSLEVEGVRGKLDANVGNGSLAVRDVHGKLNLESSFGSIEAADCRGDTEVRASNGQVTIRRLVCEELGVRSSFGGVELVEIGGNVDVESGNGSISAKNVRGSLEIESTFGQVEVAGVGGSCDVRSRNAGVSISDVEGRVGVDSTFGPVLVTGVGGDVEIEAANGNVKLRGLRGTDKRAVKCSTAFGLIEVGLADPPSLHLNARVSFGTIRSDFDLPDIKRKSNGERVECVLGSGRIGLDLEAQNGNIRLVRESKPSTN